MYSLGVCHACKVRKKCTKRTRVNKISQKNGSQLPEKPWAGCWRLPTAEKALQMCLKCSRSIGLPLSILDSLFQAFPHHHSLVPSFYPLPPPPPSLSPSLSLSLHKPEILNWHGLDLLQRAVRFLKGCTSVSACSWHEHCTCCVQVFVIFVPCWAPLFCAPVHQSDSL